MDAREDRATDGARLAAVQDNPPDVVLAAAILQKLARFL
jgi:hypothetical protein